MDSSKHCILGTQQFKPRELASQMNLSMDNGWGIVRCIIDYCMNLEKGKYLILKDPNKVTKALLSLQLTGSLIFFLAAFGFSLVSLTTVFLCSGNDAYSLPLFIIIYPLCILLLKGMIRIYDIPNNTFDSEDDDDEEEADDEDEDEQEEEIEGM